MSRQRPLIASAETPPPGATARCKDGTYSYSKTHQGTCSHHGGVAEWLDGSGSSSSATTSGATLPDRLTQTNGAPIPPTTILLAPRTKKSGCKLSANPDRRCSPGAYYKQLTKAIICSPSFRTSDYRNVPQSEKYAVEREYGLADRGYGSTMEIDHIVSLELGGSNDIANLYPEMASANPGYHVKDKLENKAARPRLLGADEPAERADADRGELAGALPEGVRPCG